MSMDKDVKKELLNHLIAAMDDRSKGKMKKPTAAPAEPVAKKDEPKAKERCADCGKMTCACDTEGGETASEEVAAPADKQTMKDRLKALVASKSAKE